MFNMTGIEIELRERLRRIAERWSIAFVIHQGDGIYNRFIVVPSKPLRNACVDDMNELINLFVIELGISIVIKRKSNNKVLWVAEVR